MWEVGEGVIVFVMRANVIRANDGRFRSEWDHK